MEKWKKSPIRSGGYLASLQPPKKETKHANNKEQKITKKNQT